MSLTFFGDDGFKKPDLHKANLPQSCSDPSSNDLLDESPSKTLDEGITLQESDQLVSLSNSNNVSDDKNKVKDSISDDQKRIAELKKIIEEERKNVQILQNDNKSINETFTAIITEVNDANNREIIRYKKTILDLEDEIEHDHDLVESLFEEKVAANKTSDATKRRLNKVIIEKSAIIKVARSDPVNKSNTNKGQTSVENIDVSNKDSYTDSEMDTNDVNLNKCHICSKTFKSVEELSDHSNTHRVKDFICDKCGIECETEPELNDHFKTYTDNALFMCNQCDKQFHTKQSLQTHKETIHIRLTQIQAVRFNDDQMEVDNESQNTELSKTCNQCGNKFKNSNDLKAHVDIEHDQDLCSKGDDDDGDYTCKHCYFQTNTKVSLQSHRKSAHPNDGSYQCKFCDMNFHSKQSLNKHLKSTHRTFKPCHRFMDNKCEYDDDCLYNHTQIQEKQHICYRCGETFISKTTLMNHIKAKHGHIQCRKFQSNQCPFTNETCLFNHTAMENKKEDLVFRSVPQNPAPPDSVNNTREKEKMNQILKNIMNEIMPLIQKEITLHLNIN